LQGIPAFAKLEKDPLSDFYFIEIFTEDISLVGTQTLSLKASFVNFPSASF